MKKLALLVVALAVAGLSAQQGNPKLRGRWGSRNPAPGVVLPRITITSPTLNPSLTVPSASFTMSGTAEAGTFPLASVTWSCPSCSTTSGTATGVETWETVGGSGAQTVVQDTFTSAANQPLAGLTASPVGGTWSEILNGGGVNFYLERRTTGQVRLNSTLANAGIAVTVAPSPAITGANYDASLTIKGLAAGDDAAGLLFGMPAVNPGTNYCGVIIYSPANATDLYLIKNVAGTVTQLGSANADPAVDDVVSVEVRGTSLDVKLNGVSKIATTDTFCDDASGVGFGVGALRGVAGDDGSTSWLFDDFTVVDQDASSGAITLAAGANTITVEVCDTEDNCATDVLTVTFTDPDAIDPVVTITQPTANPTQSTGTASITIGGSCTDNTECTSVALACPECTPTTASCTLSGTGTSKTFTCDAVTQAVGANVLTVTAQDAATNSHQDTLTSTLNTSDVTPPVVTITTNGGSDFSTSTSPTTLAGTASDAGGLFQIRWSCSPTGNGIAVGLASWSASIPLGTGANVCTVTAEDTNGNTATDSITITYTVTLAITTTLMPSATDDSAYSVTLAAVGGTAPYTWSNNGAGTTLNDGDAHCAGLSINSSGVVSGTPTTPGQCDWTAKVTDDVAATDTQALSIEVRAVGAEGPHDFFEDLIARGDCYRAYSFRPAGQTAPAQTTGTADCTKPHWSAQLGLSTRIAYNFAGDTHPERQDASKVTIPQWIASGFTLAVAMDNSQTTMTLSGATGIENGRCWKIESEILCASSTQPTSATVNVLRGQWNTSAASHAQGLAVQVGTNGLSGNDQVRVKVQTDGTQTATYLYVADLYYTGSFMKTGLTNHKTLQVAFINSGNQYVETNANYQGPTSLEPNPQWAATGGVNTNVAAFGTRFYSQSTTLGARQDNPGRPMANPPFLLKPSKWTRVWIFIEANAETDSSKFTTISGGRAPLAAAITDTTSTSISVDHTNITTNPFTACPYECAGAGWAGRAIKIDNEILTISGCTVCSGTTRTLTVVRGAQGSTAATHSVGTQIQIIPDYVTIYVADEDQNPTLMYDRVEWHIPINHATAGGSMFDFWVEFNTSTGQIVSGRALGPDGVAGTSDDFQDMIAYVRNLVVLKDPPADWSALRVKPVR